jgi:probable phosphoglycerate mutase
LATHIAFVRHGHVENPQGVHYGRLPGFGLSAAGRAQAQAAASYLHHVPIAAIYSSPLLRARQTAAAICEKHPHLQVQVTPLLTEVNAPFDGQPRRVLEARKWDVYTGTPPPYEQPANVLARTWAFVANIRAAHAGQHIVAVTHGDVVSFLILWAHGMPTCAVSYKEALAEVGIPDDYPLPASITTLIYTSRSADEIPALEHIVPYDLS